QLAQHLDEREHQRGQPPLDVLGAGLPRAPLLEQAVELGTEVEVGRRLLRIGSRHHVPSAAGARDENVNGGQGPPTTRSPASSVSCRAWTANAGAAGRGTRKQRSGPFRPVVSRTAAAVDASGSVVAPSRSRSASSR